MTKFLEININNELHLININNITYIKQIEKNITEFELFSKDKKGSKIKFKIHYNYMNFKLFLEDENKKLFDFILTADKIENI